MSATPPPVIQPLNSPRPSSGAKTSGKAIASLILGLSSFLCFILTGIPGVILGALALGEISKGQGRIKGQGLAITGIITSVLASLVLPIFLGMLLPAVQQVREAARRTESMGNLRQIAVAMLNFESAFQRFPEQAEGDEVKMSWRVQILPYLGRSDLFDRYDPTQPWDSSANLALLEEMPVFYRCPNMLLSDIEKGLTVYQVPHFDIEAHPERMLERTVFGGERGRRLNQITDGTPNTILAMEVDLEKAVPWTKPEDWEFDSQNPMRDLGNLRAGGFLVVMADGSAHFISNSVSPETLRNGFSCSDGNVVDFDVE